MTDTARTTDPGKLQQVVDDILEEVATVEDCGAPYDVLPEMAEIDPGRFGLAILTRDGDMVAAGEADHAFPIQSISKAFALSLALESFGDSVWERVDREPSGDPFNSIVDLERHEGMPRNPFINAGALVVDDMLLDLRAEGEADIPEFVRDFITRQLDGEATGIDEAVWSSGHSSGYGNRALANLAKSFGNLHHEVEEVMAVYIQQCAVTLSCRQLARAGRYLTLERVDRAARLGLAEVRRTRRVNALMLTCGQYDGSGDFAFRVGLPAKSGVGGGILAIVPNTASVAVWSPGLDDYGNSLLGTLALERLSERMDWSVFGAMGEEG